MTDMEEVKGFVASLDPEHQLLAQDAIRTMRKNGSSWEWLSVALSIKSREDWEKYGFGLMFKESFRAQVQNQLNKRHREQTAGDLWTEDSQETKPAPKEQPATTKSDYLFTTEFDPFRQKTLRQKSIFEMSEQEITTWSLRDSRYWAYVNAAVVSTFYAPSKTTKELESEMLAKWREEDASGMSDREILDSPANHYRDSKGYLGSYMDWWQDYFREQEGVINGN